MEAKPLREDSHLHPAAGWSNWKKTMVPNQPDDDPQNLQAPNGSGFSCRNIKDAFREHTRHCRIYEWQARRGGQPRRVVYVGCTCRSKAGKLRARILEYCRNGSHKRDLINDALDKGYELWVRVKYTRINTKSAAEYKENVLLDKYNYAWNERRNGVRRIVLP